MLLYRHYDLNQLLVCKDPMPRPFIYQPAQPRGDIGFNQILRFRPRQRCLNLGYGAIRLDWCFLGDPLHYSAYVGAL